jgi:membrane-associated protease RseP (regulator of RpoE activity)
MSTNSSKNTAILFIASVVFIIWIVLGFMDAKNYTSSGYQTDDNNVIVHLETDSPAEKSGMQVGDKVLSSGGIDINDNKALSQRDRPKAGDTRVYVVDRNGEEISLELTFSALNSKDRNLNTLASVVGLLFILIGLYAHNKHRTDLSLSFAVFAVCFGFIFTSGPHIKPGVLNSVVNSLSALIVIFSFATLANYLLKYPKKSKYNRNFLFVPGVLAVLLIWFLNFTQPESTGSMNMAIRLFFGAIIIFYFGTALLTLLRKYFKANSAERSSRGLNMMLVGSLIGLLPILIYFTANTISPGIDLPGNDYVVLTFAAIPIFFMLALNQLAKGDSTETTE